MHYIARSENYLLQGDILRSVPIVQTPDKIQIAKPSKAEEKNKEILEYSVADEEKIEDVYKDGPEIILAVGKRETAIVLSQTCDIQNREFVIIAPISSLDVIDNAKRRESIRKQKTFHRFYLPKSEFFEESFIDFSLLSSIKKDFLKIEDRLISLTDYWRNHLTWALNRYFCRPFML